MSPPVVPVRLDVLLRLHPVVPFELVTDRSKPPMNAPHEIPAALSRSPIFLPAIWTWLRVGAEQTSPTGSASLISVSPPLPSLTSKLLLGFRLTAIPLVCPDMRLSAPGVDGPNTVQ